MLLINRLFQESFLQFFFVIDEPIISRKLSTVFLLLGINFPHNNDDTRPTMPEPAKDTAIEITPKPPPVLSRVQSIVSEINRATTSRVGGRNKKEENNDARVLENAEPTPSRNTPEVTRIPLTIVL